MTAAPPTPRAASIPDELSIDGLEDDWTQTWREHGTYTFDRTTREQIFSIDTPQPTASGSLDMGH